MFEHTLAIFGSSGSGKSNLEPLIAEHVFRSNPMRFRPKGPRDANDIHYANPGVRAQLRSVLLNLGEQPDTFTQADGREVEFFPLSRVAMFDCRGEWQLLFPLDAPDGLLKAEIYGLAFVALLANSAFKDQLGKIHCIVLNTAQSFQVEHFDDLVKLTGDQCRKRGDSEEQIAKRTTSLKDEVASWKDLLNKFGGIECPRWPFAECVYQKRPARTLLSARDVLVSKDMQLNLFFRNEEELIADAIAEGLKTLNREQHVGDPVTRSFLGEIDQLIEAAP